MDDVNLKILACNMRRALRAPEECDIPYLLETAARELDELRAIALGQKALRRITEVENEGLRAENERLKEEVAEGGLILAGCEAMIRDLRAEVERLRAPTPLGSSPAPINDEITKSLAIDAKKHLDEECRVTEEMLNRRATI